MKKILVANRGEIAVRIIRAAKEMRIATVAVYSTADRAALHTRMATESYCIGEPPAKESYLNIDAIMEACSTSGADAIHPGYGFLSENPQFAKRVTDAGFTFIGPPAEVMEVMGSKLGAKRFAASLGIPLVRGTDHAVTDHGEAAEEARRIGYPIIIKASAGGGGKGMRVVEVPETLNEQLSIAMREAKAAFGDSSVFLERYIASPRHIEIQVFADSHRNTVHLFERECSVQRRHQKIIEEAPSAVLTPALREAMGEAAVRLSRGCQYVGAGTVEFMLDEHANFYFLEMNTRLQVEHPVTELVTGIDLVKAQIRVARGEILPFSQPEITLRGHAIELRVYAEDPSTGFLPDTGLLETYELPQGPGVRVDNGVEQGMTIPVYYDPLLAKLIVYAANRETAIETMKRAISEYKIRGVSNTLAFGTFVMEHEAFRSGNFDTHFVKKYFTGAEEGVGGTGVQGNAPSPEAEIAAGVAYYVLEKKKDTSSSRPKTQVGALTTNSKQWRSRRRNYLS